MPKDVLVFSIDDEGNLLADNKAVYVFIPNLWGAPIPIRDLWPGYLQSWASSWIPIQYKHIKIDKKLAKLGFQVDWLKELNLSIVDRTLTETQVGILVTQTDDFNFNFNPYVQGILLNVKTHGITNKPRRSMQYYALLFYYNEITFLNTPSLNTDKPKSDLWIPCTLNISGIVEDPGGSTVNYT